MHKASVAAILGLGLFAWRAYADPPRPAGDRTIRTDLLTPDQLLLHNWTEDRFGDLLHRDHVRRFSEQSRNALVKHSLATLDEAVHRKWDAYGWHDEKFAYQSIDYEVWEAINVLCALRDPSAKPKLLEIATARIAKDNRERWMAVRALALLGEVDDVPRLIPLLYHQNVNTRIWTQIALIQITGVDKGSDWKKWAEWWNESHRDRKLPDELVVWPYPADATKEDRSIGTNRALLDKEASDMIRDIAIKALATGRLKLHPGFKPD